MLTLVDPRQRESVDARAELAEHSGQQRQRRGENEDDRDHDPQCHRAERRRGHEHHGGQRDEHRDAAEEDRLAGGVHRLPDGVGDRFVLAEERAAEAVDDEERVVDPEGEREHEGEIHRPDRDVEQLGADIERPGGGDESGDRQQQRQTGRDERAEGEHEDDERHRPGDELALHHGRAIGRVEVGPHAAGTGERHLHAVALEFVELGLEVVGGTDHRVGVGSRRALDDRGVAVTRDRRSGLGGDHRAHARIGLQRGRGLRHALLECRVGDCGGIRVHHDPERARGEALEVAIDCLARRDGLRAARLPSGSGERRLHLGREHAKADDDDEPDEADDPDVARRPAAQAPDGAELGHQLPAAG
ncbi:unannotated protein [freshwater metagenome]|uniref:Unannotated protein n=1 Tax=freshwater metagenome TaxID=449393 RepID=A0A6J7CXP2_9ZZZZ